jgi:hypothetical protein
MKPDAPKTARELRERLVLIVPAFGEACTEEEMREEESLSAVTLHFVMQRFAEFFGGAQASLSQRQLAALGAFLSQAVENDDDLENAVSTCFLEHLRQIRGYEALAPHLTALAKRKTHA